MTQSPNMFLDPSERPVKFFQKVPKPIFAFGESSFPVSFSFSRSPRNAVFAGASAVQLETYMTDKNIHTNSSIVQLGIGESQNYVLSCVGSDISTAIFYLTTIKSDGSFVATPEYGLSETRQPSFEAAISHSFSTHTSTELFDPVIMHGDPFYPSATMRLTVHRLLSSGIEDLASIDVPAGGETRVVMAPSLTWGIVDVEIEVILEWYENSSRTTIAENPPIVQLPNFGFRMYVSESSKFVEKIVLAESACVATALYPTSILRNLGGESVTLAYWGVGEDGVGLFWGREEDIEVSINGMAIQLGAETASYILDNQLEDYDLSSSSSLSSSSLNSQSSDSTVLNPSSESSSSTVSVSSRSSKITSSRSSRSSSSLSSSSSQSSSTLAYEVSSSSSSTALLDLSTSSSVVWNISKSSSSSLIASILARYSFSSSPNVFKQVEDESGNGNTILLGTESGGIGPPIWGSDYGISGGGFKFVADSTHSDYLHATTPAWIATAKSIAFWAKIGTTGNRTGIPICISNGFVGSSYKTEFAMQLESLNGRLSTWIKMNGTTIWEANTANGSVPVGSWAHFVISHNGVAPLIYINGVASSLTFTTATVVGKRTWISELTTTTYPSDRFVVGGAPRYFSPYVALGFSGQMDEIIIWDESISESDAEAEYSRMESLSSMSFSSES